MLSKARALSALKAPGVYAISRRGFLTNEQMREHLGVIRDLPVTVQEWGKCRENCVNLLRETFPGRAILEFPFTNDFDKLHEYLRVHEMVAFPANNVSQQQTAATSASRYTSGMHVVVIIRAFVNNGQWYFLIFDGDNTVLNPGMQLLQAYADAQGRDLSDLTPQEIWSIGANGLFRIEPAASFLQGSSQAYAMRDPDGVPYVMGDPLYVPSPPSPAPPPPQAASFWNWWWRPTVPPDPVGYTPPQPAGQAPSSQVPPPVGVTSNVPAPHPVGNTSAPLAGQRFPGQAPSSQTPPVAVATSNVPTPAPDNPPPATAQAKEPFKDAAYWKGTSAGLPRDATSKRLALRDSPWSARQTRPPSAVTPRSRSALSASS